MSTNSENHISSCKKVLLTLFFILFFSTGWVFAQNIVVNPSTDLPSEVIACGDVSLFKFRLFGPTAANEQVSVLLPPQSEFAGLVSTQGISVDATDLNKPVFTIATPLIDAISFIDVSYEVRTGCKTMSNPELTHELVSNTAINTTVSYPTVLYSALEVNNTILPSSVTLDVEEIQDFTYTIGNDPVNPLAYSNNIISYITHSTNVELTYSGTGSFSLGTAVGGVVTDTLRLGAAEIATIGDNDSRFEQNENIAITITAKLLGCPSGAGEAISYQAVYGGCLSSMNACQTGNASTSGIALTSGAPDLHTEVVKKAWPGLTTTDTAEFLLRNDGTGSGDIYNLTLDLGFSNGGSTYIPNDYSIFSWSNFNVNGTFFPNQGTEGSFADFQLNVDPDGLGIGLEDLDDDGFFDDLPVGNSFILKVELAYNYLLDSNNDTPCDEMNRGYSRVRWAYEFQDQCGNSIGLNVPNNGLNTWRPWSFYNTQSIATNINSSSGSSNLTAGDTFDFFISTSSGQTPTTTSVPGLHWEVHYTLPTGIVPNGNGVWGAEPFNLLSFNAGTGVAIYTSSTAPTRGFNINQDPQIPLMVDPACASSYVGKIAYEYHMKGDPTYEPVHICSEGPTFTVSCSGGTPAVCVSNFSLDRTTLGYTDMTETTPITPTTPGIRLDHVLEGDMVRWHLEIDINENNLTSAQALLEYDSNNWFSSQGDGGVKSIQVEYIPSGGGPSTISNNLGHYNYVQNNAGKSNHTVDLLGGDFIAITPLIGDKYVVDVDLKVSETCAISDVRYDPMTGILASAPVTSTADTAVHTCNYLTEEFGILAYKTPSTQVIQQSITIDGCNQFNLGIRFHLATYSKIGDLFPNEFRNFAIPKIVDILVPIGVDYVPGTASYRGYGEFNHAISDPIITYNFEPGFHKYSWTNNGSWSKEKASASYAIKDVNFKAVANCNIENWSFSDNKMGIIVLPTTEFEIFRNISIPGRNHNMTRRTNTRNTQYLPLSYSVSSPTPTVSTNTNSATWLLNINNTTSGGADLNNTWVAIEVQNNNLVPTLWDGATQIPLISYGTGKYWGKMGDVTSSGKNLEIRSNDFTVCGTDSFNVRVGQNCTQYPSDPDTGYPYGSSGTNYNCNEETIQLSLSTQEPSLNVATTLGTPPATYDFCDVVPYEIDVKNAANGYAYALGAIVKLPVGMVLDTNSGILNYDSVDYIVNSSQITHNVSTNIYTVDISATTGSAMSGVNGFPGVSEPNPNEFKLTFELAFTCDYVSGSKITTKLTGESSCKQAIDPDQGQSEIKTNPVNVTQVPSNIDYTIAVNSDDNKLYACGQTEAISVSITNQGVTTDGNIEKIVATIDDAFNYVSGSYSAGTNGPAGAPTVTVNTISGERELTWSMPDGIAAASTIAFDFEVEVVNPSTVSCQDYDLTLSTRIEQTVDCSSTGGPSCPSINSITAQEDEPITVEKSEVVITSISTNSTKNGNKENISANFSLENTSSIPLPSGVQVSAYFDANTDGIYDSGDILLGTSTINNPIAANTTVNNTVNFTTFPSQVCNVIMVVRQQDNSCICAPDETAMLPPSQVDRVAGIDRTFCEDDTRILGRTNNPNYSYVWSGANAQETGYLNDLNAARPTFSYSGPPLTANTSFTYTLTVTRPNGCSSTDQVNVNVRSLPIATITETDASCGIDNGSITFTYADNPDFSGIEFSLDGQATYETSVNDNSGSVIYSNLAAGSYDVWARWSNNQCPVDLGTIMISTIPEVTITTHPANQSVLVGKNAIYSVAAQNTDTYQWEVSTDGLTFNTVSDGSRYSDSQTNTLTVIAAEKAMHGYLYRVRVSNSETPCSAFVSDSALLSVNVRTVITNRRITHRVNKN